ncbi:response regulator transcription factor [Streptomyces purpurascens]|uniref:Response regulator transcription factor n=1 Tax=Streptomyces purpurascens TaxID=1924 RepID=A0ABZ1MMA9_STREF|nr:response regulator transcription factor [Streptomyces purpurascens]MCE7047249.1 response regulator transcription factor [Streptomyces purpurascens]GHA40101.1 DNA-binding response regulator [Streptomyces purpurascens]
MRSPRHVRSSKDASTTVRADPFRRLSVALACAEGDWPHDDWPDPDDPYVGRALAVSPPFHALLERPLKGAVDVVVLRCEDPSTAYAGLLKATGAMGVPVIVVSPRQDPDTVVEVFRGGAGYLVEGEYCTDMLSSAVMAAMVGSTYLSPSACAALRDAAQRMPGGGEAERLRSLLSPREREIMELLSTGLGAQEIGLRLRLTEKTVRNNLSNIYAKLDARGGTDAALRWLGATPGDQLGSTAR